MNEKTKSTQTNTRLRNKLFSYAAVASSFIATSGSEAQAQCGLVDEFNPVLAIDIDGDGTIDSTVIDVLG